MRLSEEYRADLAAVAQGLSAAQLQQLSGKRILVTGASGLIGSCVVDLLMQICRTAGVSYQVIALGRHPESLQERFAFWGAALKSGALTCEKWDALQTEPVPGADYFIHCASNAHPVVYATAPVETLLTVTKGTEALLAAAKEQPESRVLLVSSSEVYGQKPGNEPFAENEYGYVDILNPRACYPNGKRVAETLCAAYQDEYGVDFVVARPGHVYGPTATAADSRAHAQFARRAAAGQPVELKSAGLQLRSYMYVVDAASALLWVLLSGETGAAYNISNPNTIITIRELATAFAQAGGVDLAAAELTEEEKRGANLMSNSSLTSDALEALGWQPCFSTEVATAHTVAMLRENL